MDNDEIKAGLASNGAKLEMIVETTKQQQAQIDEITKGVAALTASFDAYKEDLDFAKQGRTMLREHTVSAEKQLQELRDMMKEHERRLAVLEDGARQGTRDSEEGDNAVRSEMNKGFSDIRADIASLHSDIAEIKASAGNKSLRAWYWIGGIFFPSGEVVARKHNVQVWVGGIAIAQVSKKERRQWGVLLLLLHSTLGDRK